MDQINSESNSETFRNPSENYSDPSENDQNVFEDHSQQFGNVPNALPKKERTDDHTLTVRDVTHIFEQQGFSITGRTITNWCKPNAKGICRLDCFYEENDYRYYVTPQSVEAVLKEERSRLQKYMQPSWQPSETFSAHSESQPENFETVPTPSENVAPNFPNLPPASESVQKNSDAVSETPRVEAEAPKTTSERKDDGSQVWELQAQIVELKIENRAKDLFIEQLKNDREMFRKSVEAERQQFVDVISRQASQIGEHKEKLLQLEVPRQGERVHEVHTDVEYPPHYGNVPNERPKEGEGQPT